MIRIDNDSGAIQSLFRISGNATNHALHFFLEHRKSFFLTCAAYIIPRIIKYACTGPIPESTGIMGRINRIRLYISVFPDAFLDTFQPNAEIKLYVINDILIDNFWVGVLVVTNIQAKEDAIIPEYITAACGIAFLGWGMRMGIGHFLPIIANKIAFVIKPRRVP